MTNLSHQKEARSNLERIEKLGFKQILKRIGPGLILTGVVIGPGNITTSAMIGANYGYSMLWLMLPIIFMRVTFMLTSYRIAMLSGMPILHAIRHYYGKTVSAFVGIALFLSCLFFTLGNVSGTGAGMHLIFGIDWKLGALIMLVILMYCYFSKGVYSKIEKAILICILGMILSFYATLVASGGPEWSEFGKGLLNWKLPEGSLTTALAYISTNAAVTAGIYGTYLGVEKKWKKEDLFNGAMLWDAIAHVVSVILISGAIILVGAIVLHPQNITIQNPSQLADLLVPFLGSAARIVMGIALLGAGFSSLLGNTQRGMVLLGAGFDKEVSLESKFIRWGCVACLVFACLICFSYNGSPTQLIFLANVATAIATPVAGLFIVLILWKKEIHAGYKVPLVLQLSMTISYLFVLVMTASALQVYIPKLVESLSH
ncbi:Nramp family divalent metal transporter [Streptococcus merionis]|uniref:Metal ion (Mn2+ iron) transporter (Nramp family) n=1 Tax=Streptococcus merionis TaxID=400065 RepID=A0A239SS08_9STRE|nr:Nramp family divalent metal transporter [Streptococcus merionis]SNU88146.1 metal ion (Mn2+; iron) transporter (Nramp family) [Streptococcus merionis]